MKQSYPDLCLEHITNAKEILQFEIVDLSQKIFDEELFCYSSTAYYNNQKLIGIGVDSNDYKAASKCLSELLERYFVSKYFSVTVESNLYGASFHPVKKQAQQICKHELIERITLADLFINHVNHLSKIRQIQKIPLAPKYKRMLKNYNVKCYQVEFIKNQFIIYVELSANNLLANGFSYYNNNLSDSIEKATMEAFRRFAVVNEGAHNSFISLEELIQQNFNDRDNLNCQNKRINKLVSLCKYMKIDGLGYIFVNHISFINFFSLAKVDDLCDNAQSIAYRSLRIADFYKFLN